MIVITKAINTGQQIPFLKQWNGTGSVKKEKLGFFIVKWQPSD